MQGSVRYVLGLDLGTSSVGWALVKMPEDESKAEIVRLGVRKFLDAYTSGDSADKKNTTKNAERRTARLMRRLANRKAGRRRRTMALLLGAGLAARGDNPFPGLPEFRFSPYDLWARAYDQDLSAFEFGRVLYLLAHRRGFKSNLGAGLGNLAQRPEIVKYLRQEEAAEQAKAVKVEKKESEDDEGKTLVQIGHWNDSFSGVGLGTFFFALLNPGPNAEDLRKLAKNPEAVEKLHGNFDRQQLRNKAANPLWAKPDRAAYEQEFERLWQRQAPHLKLGQELKEALHHAIFFQNPLAFPQDNRAFCPYGTVVDQETGENLPAYRSPKCNLLYQEYRLRKLLADMKLKETASSEYRHPTTEEKDKLFDLLNQNGEATWKVMAKAIGLPNAVFEPSERRISGGDYNEKRIVGNKIASWFQGRKEEEPAGGELRDLWEFPERFLRDDLKSLWKGTDKGRREAVRHHLVRIIGEAPFARADRLGKKVPEASAERVVTLVQTDFDLSDVAAFRLALTNFPQGYASLSYQAMSRLLPHLREGKMEWEAIRDEFKSEEAAAVRAIVRWLPAPPSPQDILSPRVRKSLNQARQVIHALYREHPDVEIDEIRVELARRMQEGNEKYGQTLAYQAYTQKINEQARRKWDELPNAGRVPKSYVEKYRLWVEQGFRCPYSDDTEPMIGQADLLDGTKLEVDHIWPRQLGGDSFGNKVLVFRETNQRKGGKAPWEMDENWRTRVAHRMRAWSVLNAKPDETASKQSEHLGRIKPSPKAIDIARGKINRVTTSHPPKERDDGFTDRHAVETGYIAREAVTYLSPLSRHVVAIKSTFSTSLAKNWGFYKRLSALHEEDKVKIPVDKKDRILNRHHAVDALATALCSPKIIYQVVSLEKEQAELRDPQRALREIDPDTFVPVEDAERRSKWFRKQLGKLQPTAIVNGLSGELAQVIVSYQPRHNPRGKLFNEQPFGISKHTIVGEGSLPKLNSRKHVSALKAEQVFPQLAKKKKESAGSDEDDQASGAVRGGVIKSELSRKRIADHLVSKGFGPERGKEAIDKFLVALEDGIPYQARMGQRWIRQVLLQVPADKQSNYRIVDGQGGKTLYTKLERHCAVIVANGKKSIMEVVPLVDAATQADELHGDYERSIIAIAAQRSGRPIDEMIGGRVFHKGDLVRIRFHGEEDWASELYKVEVLDGGGKRLWLRAHWSADRETIKSKAVGSLIASASVYEFRPEYVSPTGRFEEQL